MLQLCIALENASNKKTGFLFLHYRGFGSQHDDIKMTLSESNIGFFKIKLAENNAPSWMTPSLLEFYSTCTLCQKKQSHRLGKLTVTLSLHRSSCSQSLCNTLTT